MSDKCYRIKVFIKAKTKKKAQKNIYIKSMEKEILFK